MLTNQPPWRCFVTALLEGGDLVYSLRRPKGLRMALKGHFTILVGWRSTSQATLPGRWCARRGPWRTRSMIRVDPGRAQLTHRLALRCWER